jgi:hypothetical protein
VDSEGSFRLPVSCATGILSISGSSEQGGEGGGGDEILRHLEQTQRTGTIVHVSSQMRLSRAVGRHWWVDEEQTTCGVEVGGKGLLKKEEEKNNFCSIHFNSQMKLAQVVGRHRRGPSGR